ncbi:MAG: thiosulfate oxidation carrier protein SoxY [Pseudomonadota bacterium]|jgi:sulfur-oxidizing protein SoxY
MNMTTRRSFIGTLGLGAGWVMLAGSALVSRVARAVDRAAFDVDTLDEVVAKMGGKGYSPSTDIDFSAPEIADNGATVPVEVSSRLPGTRCIAIVVDKNPHPLSCAFNFSADAVPFVNTRIKVGETSQVTALVQTDQGFFIAQRTVKVTLGGCGG